MHKVVYITCLLLLLTACKRKVTYDYQPEERSNTQENLIKANRVLVKKDKQRIMGVIERNNWNMKETPTGLWYEILAEGSGDTAKMGQIVSLKYTLSLLDGTVCYSSEELGEKEFEIGHGGVEAGLEQAVLFCKTGTQARFILPPYMAYGLPGDGDKIPARAALVYSIEVTKLTNKN